jgi:PAP2 superfamily protein
MMFTVPILVLALIGQAPSTSAPAENTAQTEQVQPAGNSSAEPADGAAADPNATPDSGQNTTQNPAQSPVPAQKPPSKHDLNEPPTPEHTGIRALFGNLLQDFKLLPSMQNAYIAGAGGAAALAVHPADQSVNTYMINHYTQFNAFFAAGKYIGNTPEQIAGAIATYAWGRYFDEPKISHLGMDLLQGQIMAEVLFNPIKFATQRLRPNGSDHLSFPSGHSSVTFATATVLERHLGWRKAALAYVVATYVATSRLHDNDHWLSDVVFGAAVGTIAGRTVVHHAADYWAVTPVKVPGGVAIMVSRTAQK